MSAWLLCDFRNMLHKDSDEARRQRARQGLAEGIYVDNFIVGIQKL